MLDQQCQRATIETDKGGHQAAQIDLKQANGADREQLQLQEKNAKIQGSMLEKDRKLNNDLTADNTPRKQPTVMLNKR